MNGKLLVISNAAMCQGDSNGRTIARLLDGLRKEEKAQFFVYGNPDFEECSSYYQVSDNDALNSLIRHEKKNGEVAAPKESTKSGKTKKARKSPLKMLLREFAWKHGCWKNEYLKGWMDKMDPYAILVVAGDNCFILDLARRIARDKKIPLFLYSTEEYPFKDYNYLTKRPSLFYALFYSKLKRAYKRIAPFVRAGFYNNEALEKIYRERYGYPCYTAHQSSEIDWEDRAKLEEPIKVSYLGNLGLNRQKALIEIANALGRINPDLRLDVYGNAAEKTKEELAACPYVSYHGLISYEEVLKVIHSSALLVHAERKDDFYTRDLKYAFSTKIADSVSSGTPFLIYAPQELAETEFLKEKRCAFVATNEDELEEQIRLALSDESKRKEILGKAKIVREDCFTNKGEFIRILRSLL